jgi:hypothetical protein
MLSVYLDQMFSQVASAWADLEDDIPAVNAAFLDNSLKHALIDDKVLP